MAEPQGEEMTAAPPASTLTPEVLTATEDRHFCERYMAAMIGMLLEQQLEANTNMPTYERNDRLVQESLQLAVMLIARDLESQLEMTNGHCRLLDTFHALGGFFHTLAQVNILCQSTEEKWNVCKMQYWWFLSESPEEAPTTNHNLDIAYFEHSPMELRGAMPTDGWMDGWLKCPVGRLGIEGARVCYRHSSSCAMGHWERDCGIFFWNTTIQSEVVTHWTRLIMFLARMINRYSPPCESQPLVPPFSIQSWHLLSAWKLCVTAPVEEISAQLYKIFASILPACSVVLAVRFLRDLQTSLGGNHLIAVSEFCWAPALLLSRKAVTRGL